MVSHVIRAVNKQKEKLNVDNLYTTAEAAKLAGISRQTLQTWIVAERIQAPELLRPFHLRLWTSEDVARLKQVEHRKFRRKPGRTPQQPLRARAAVSANT